MGFRTFIFKYYLNVSLIMFNSLTNTDITEPILTQKAAELMIKIVARIGKCNVISI